METNSILKELSECVTDAFCGTLVTKHRISELNRTLTFKTLPSKLQLLSEITAFLLLDKGTSQNYGEIISMSLVESGVKDGSQYSLNVGWKEVMTDAEKVKSLFEQVRDNADEAFGPVQECCSDGKNQTKEAIPKFALEHVTNHIQAGLNMISQIEQLNYSLNNNPGTNPIVASSARQVSALTKYIPAIEELFLQPLLKIDGN